jgi:hypothetical protein
MTRFSAYFDESTGNDSPILVVAGFLSTDAQWSLFIREWKEVLAGFAISAFHMRGFAHRTGEFRGMEERARQQLMGRLLGIITRRAKLGFAAAVHIKEFEAVFTGSDRTEIGSPYKLGCTANWLEIGERAQKHYQVEPIDFFFDAGHSNKGEVQQSFRESKQNPEFVQYRLGTIHFADDKMHAPLQAADMAAYGFWRWLDAHFAVKTRHGRYPFQEIVKIPWTIREFDRSSFEEMQVQRKGGRVDKKIVHRVISALRPGQTDAPHYSN